MEEKKADMMAGRQSMNVYRMHRGNLAHLGLDPAKISEIRQRTREITFSVKYEQRRNTSANVRRSAHLNRLSAIDKSNLHRTHSVVAAAQQAEHDVWQLVRAVLPVRKLKAQIMKHVVVDEKSPFVLYAIMIESDYSRFITKNTFENYEILQKKLISLENQVVLSKTPQNVVLTHRLKDVLPRLPTSFLSIFWKKSVLSDADLAVSSSNVKVKMKTNNNIVLDTGSKT